ncbi:hypothetical protein [Burkholderia seminalis]|uniref:hypothetical protein n=1 Tax=Burkholderia seminalis TaxID=488731 RepID=UPI0019046EA0|nr:hypothetical protein [Burkholderia seminalis]MBJ9594779.1 hypothetical protein [Burkholderia seminalis]
MAPIDNGWRGVLVADVARSWREVVAFVSTFSVAPMYAMTKDLLRAVAELTHFFVVEAFDQQTM